MDTIKVFCAGKINLSLNILGRGERLHYLDSIMQAVSIGDIVTATKRADNNINIVFTGGCFVDGSIGENNSVKKAVDALRSRFKEFNGFGADIIVEKNLPVGGGLGGSSADAAGAILALNALYGLDKGINNGLNNKIDNDINKGLNNKIDKGINNGLHNGLNKRIDNDLDKGIDTGLNNDGGILFEIAKTVGSDVPFSMQNVKVITDSNPPYPLSPIHYPLPPIPYPLSTARVTGTGDIITPVKNNLKTHIVIAMQKDNFVNSGDAYRVFDGLYPDFKLCPSDNNRLERALSDGDISAFSLMGNALTAPSQKLCAGIKKTRDALDAAGAFYTLMTGSGCCVVGFFKNKEESEKAAAKLIKDGFWAKAS